MPKIIIGRVKGEDGEANVDTAVEYEEPSSYVEPESGDSIRILFSKISKGLKELFSNKIDKSSISNNFATTDWSQVAAAPLAKQLNDTLTTVTNAVSSKDSVILLGETVTINYTVNCDSSIYKEIVIKFTYGGNYQIVRKFVLETLANGAVVEDGYQSIDSSYKLGFNFTKNSDNITINDWTFNGWIFNKCSVYGIKK